MSDYKPASSISHLMLAGTAGWALKTLPSEYHLVCSSFALLMCNGIFGVMSFTSTNKTLNKMQEIVSVAADSMALPLLNAQLYMGANYRDAIVWIHICSGLLPISCKCILEDSAWIEYTVLMGNMISLWYFRNNNAQTVWCGSLLFLTFMNKFIFEGMSYRFDIPSCDVAALGHCFYTMLALGCLTDSVD